MQACEAAGGRDHDGFLLTDRTFLVKAVKIMKAKAVLEGRSECIAQDLEVLLVAGEDWLLTVLLGDVISEHLQDPSNP